MKIDLTNPKFLRELAAAANQAYRESSDPFLDSALMAMEQAANDALTAIDGPQMHIPGPRAKRERDLVAQAMEIYEAYPRKVGRPAAIKAIMKHLRAGVDFDRIYGATIQFSECVRGWPINTDMFIPHPSTWYNQERFNDDPKTWKRNLEKPEWAKITTPDDRYTDHLIDQMRKI